MSNHQINMRSVMQMAWAFVRNNGMKMADAMRVAWRNFKLKAKMLAGKAYFSFVKKDGSIRVACGTLVQAAINYIPNGRGRPTPDHLQRYWDADCNGYRMFDRSNLICVA